MLYKTRGIALSYIRYRETSIIAKIFTERFGLQTYIVNGVRNTQSKVKIAMFQPLTLLDLVVYYRKGQDIHRISELRLAEPFKTLPFNIRKAAIALFMTELLSQVLKEDNEPAEIFAFLHDAVLALDQLTEGFQSFHLVFMYRLSHFLGIKPESGNFILQETGHTVSSHLAGFFDQLDQEGWQHLLNVSRQSRNQLLKVLIDYYNFHYDSIREFKSLDVLSEVFK